MKDQRHPPGWAMSLMSRLLKKEVIDEIEGDLYEAFYWRSRMIGHKRARLLFAAETIRSMRPSNLRGLDQSQKMNFFPLRNNLKSAGRNIKKGGIYTLINIGGLSTGIAAALLIFLYCYQIFSWDQFHENSSKTFLVYKERITPTGTQKTYDTWVPLRQKLLDEYPQIVAAARTFNTSAKVRQGMDYVESQITYTDQDFFDIFSFPSLEGDKKSYFENLNNAVLTESSALKHFGSKQVVGKSLDVYFPSGDTTMTYLVSGVISDPPFNSTIQPEILLNFKGEPDYAEYENMWGGSFIENYIMLREPSDRAGLSNRFPDLIVNIWDQEVADRTNFKLLPLESSYDTFIGDVRDANVLFIVALGILLLAVINFVNLSTARAIYRSKEVGIKKVLGAGRLHLQFQFMLEALLVVLVSTALGVTIYFLATPYVTKNLAIELHLELIPIPNLAFFLLGFVFILSILCGLYPALHLSGFQLLTILGGVFKTKGGEKTRNFLVTSQFTLTIMMLIATFVVRDQLNHMLKAKKGFSEESLLVIEASQRDFESRELGRERLKTFKNQLLSQSYISSVSATRSYPSNWVTGFTFVKPTGWEGDPLRMSRAYVDASFLPTMKIRFVSGRNFLDDSEGDQRSSVIINEAAAKAFGFDYEKENTIMLGSFKCHVVGIVEDFNYQSLKLKIEPTLIFHRTANHGVHRYLMTKIDTRNLNEHLSLIEKIWEDLDPISPLNYAFLDEKVARMYAAEKAFLALVTLFTFFSLFIAGLGLYGMTVFVVEKKRKEISIRKVIGASLTAIVVSITKGFTRWIILGILVGVPAAVYFMNLWLEHFEYRTSLDTKTFVLSLMAIAFITVLSVSYQVVQAALQNPTKYLKNE